MNTMQKEYKQMSQNKVIYRKNAFLKKAVSLGMTIVLTMNVTACGENTENSAAHTKSLSTTAEIKSVAATDEATDHAKDSANQTENYFHEYAKLIKYYEKKYGAAQAQKESEWYFYMKGLCFMKLVDFAHDGQEELLLVYEKDADDGNYGVYTYEIWSTEDNKLSMLDKGEVFGNNSYVQHIYLADVEGKTYLINGDQEYLAEYYFHGYQGEEFTTVKTIIWEKDEAGDIIGSIDGERASYETMELEEEKWFWNMVDHDLNHTYDAIIEQNEETKRKLNYYDENEPSEADCDYFENESKDGDDNFEKENEREVEEEQISDFEEEENDYTETIVKDNLKFQVEDENIVYKYDTQSGHKEVLFSEEDLKEIFLIGYYGEKLYYTIDREYADFCSFDLRKQEKEKLTEDVAARMIIQKGPYFYLKPSIEEERPEEWLKVYDASKGSLNTISDRHCDWIPIQYIDDEIYYLEYMEKYYDYNNIANMKVKKCSPDGTDQVTLLESFEAWSVFQLAKDHVIFEDRHSIINVKNFN